FFIITTAKSSRHLQSLAENARAHLAMQNLQMRYQSDKNDDSGWLLLDCGFFIVHLMDSEKRAFYELEKLMFQSPVIDYSSNSL
ncbi:MAG: ribosome silencing factor, partial [Spirochaetaceae bacterium]